MKKGLSKNPLLGTSEIDELFELSEEKNLLTIKKDQVLFHENMKPAGVYYLKEGSIRIFSTDAKGKEHIIGITSPGHYIGLGSLLRNKKNPGTGVAIEDSVVCFIPKKEFFKLTSRYPQLSHRLLVKFCYQLDKAEDKLISLSNKSSKEKLAEILLLLGKDTETGKGKNSIHITSQDLASLVGTKSEIISSYLKEFDEKRIIDHIGNQITLLCLDGLAKICNQNINPQHK
jgi:CRP/FNR family transcriptional regulator, polysaccharide utilization system transcription regulator